MPLPADPFEKSFPNGGVSPAVEEVRLAAGQRVGAGRFVLERMIGRGGMGTVWLAMDERLNEKVALKFISERIRGNPEALGLMRQETSRSHSLSHQNIVRIHDLHEVAGEPAFISMEFVDGQNLHELAKGRDGKSFGLDEVYRWSEQLCAALGYAHSRGVIHRDLKPANLMLDRSGEIKMADFGLAAALREPVEAQDQSVSGTLAYMSPQQLSGAPATVSDDIYSLGACIFELLAGRPVFDGPGIRRKIEFEPAPWLSTAMKGEVSEEFEDLLLRCLSKDPANRPESASAFLDQAAVALGKRKIEEPKAVGKKIWSRKAALAGLLVVAAILALVSNLMMKSEGPAFLDLRGAPVWASSFVPPSSPDHAFDKLHRSLTRKETTRWAADSGEENAGAWIAVDLGQDMRLDTLMIDWELAFAKDFSIRTRTSAEGFLSDPNKWTERGKVGGYFEQSYALINNPETRNDVVFDFDAKKVTIGTWMSAKALVIDRRPVVARYVMVQATAHSANNARIYSIYEIEIAASPAP